MKWSSDRVSGKIFLDFPQVNILPGGLFYTYHFPMEKCIKGAEEITAGYVAHFPVYQRNQRTSPHEPGFKSSSFQTCLI